MDAAVAFRIVAVQTLLLKKITELVAIRATDKDDAHAEVHAVRVDRLEYSCALELGDVRNLIWRENEFHGFLL